MRKTISNSCASLGPNTIIVPLIGCGSPSHTPRAEGQRAGFRHALGGHERIRVRAETHPWGRARELRRDGTLARRGRIPNSYRPSRPAAHGRDQIAPPVNLVAHFAKSGCAEWGGFTAFGLRRLRFGSGAPLKIEFLVHFDSFTFPPSEAISRSESAPLSCSYSTVSSSKI